MCLSLNLFVPVHPFAIFINNQLNGVASFLCYNQLSKDMYMLLDSRPLLGLASAEKYSTDHFVWVCELQTPKLENSCKIKSDLF